jgi:antitoxin (DNA-binding transcriptional repressor) of toxin-antitoxin stability system
MVPPLVKFVPGARRLLVQTIAIQQAKEHLCEIIDKLSPGEEVIVTRDNQPVATIRATPTSGESPRFGTLRGSILHVAADFDAIPEGFEDYLP